MAESSPLPASPKRTIHKMRVAQVIDHNPNIREVVFTAIEPTGICFKAGQFATLHIPKEPKAVMRAYSFASDEKDQKEFHLIFKKVEGGVASEYVWAFKGGEIIDFTGPFGRVFFREPPSPQIIFLNTGSGVSQHFSYLISKKEQYPNLKYRMLIGLRHKADIYYREQLDNLKKHLTDFQYEVTLSQPDSSWTGKTGYVQQHLADFDFKSTETTFYLCGNGGMIKEVKKLLIEKENFDKTRILVEAFS